MRLETEENPRCELNVFDQEQRQRHLALINEILYRKQGTRELPTGYRVDFPYDLALFLKISEWISLEHLCCPFFEFDLRLGKGKVSLSITGDAQAKLFLQSWIAK